MDAKWYNYAAALVIALLFIVLAPLFGVVALVTAALGARRYPANIMKALDKATAAGFGYDGTKTLSKECGLALLKTTGCKVCALPCRLLCYTLDRLLEKEHCEKEAE